MDIMQDYYTLNSRTFLINMDTKSFQFDLELDLIPTVGNTAPHVVIRLDDLVLFDSFLSGAETVKCNCKLIEGSHLLDIQLTNKSAVDPVQAIQIKRVSLNGIVDDKFIWNGTYYPEYPEPWASEQQALGNVLSSKLQGVNYLGWNGLWQLEFTSPVFTWIHKTCALGWIYD
jgi:hypothetical protein